MWNCLHCVATRHTLPYHYSAGQQYQFMKKKQIWQSVKPKNENGRKFTSFISIMVSSTYFLFLSASISFPVSSSCVSYMFRTPLHRYYFLLCFWLRTIPNEEPGNSTAKNVCNYYYFIFCSFRSTTHTYDTPYATRVREVKEIFFAFNFFSTELVAGTEFLQIKAPPNHLYNVHVFLRKLN